MLKNTALFIGRFQPFHNGHLDAIKQILAHPKIDQILIGIGSAENDFLPNCPFTAGERFEMIWRALEEAKIPRECYFIIPIRNLERFSLWSTHVVRLLPDFQYAFSGSNLIQSLFRKYQKGIKIVKLKKRVKICATLVREAIVMNKNWQKMVPKAVANYLTKLGAPERLLEITKC